MKVLKYLVYTLLLVFVMLVVVGLFLPPVTHVERSIVIDAKPVTVFELVTDFRQVSQWSPWSDLDPGMEVQYTGPTGLGAAMSWQSDDPAIGSGRQEITDVDPNRRVESAIEFEGEGAATSFFQFDEVEQGTEVTWGFDIVHGLNLPQRYMGLMMDEWVGNAYEKGLANLKDMAESMPSVVTQEITYEANGTELQGYLALPRDATDRPGVLVVHEWWGHNAYARRRAEQLAELGYVAFALDMYGKGKVADHPDNAKQYMMEVVSNLDVAKTRFAAALDLLKSRPETDPEQMAAIGYCFGGAVVLSMARQGVNLDGVVSFHGTLGGLAPIVDDPQQAVEAQFLIFNGADDPFVTAEQEQTFKQQMDAAGLDYEFIEYEGVKHAFTNPDATEMGQKFDLPLVYDEEADQDSWQRMRTFLDTIFTANH